MTATLTAGVVELLRASVLLIFALTALALIDLAWVLGQATESPTGRSHWLEGAMVLGVFIISAIAFFSP